MKIKNMNTFSIFNGFSKIFASRDNYSRSFFKSLAHCLLVVYPSNNPSWKRDDVDDLSLSTASEHHRNSQLSLSLSLFFFHTPHYFWETKQAKILKISEIQRNREFYKNADVRPPFTYASLIRQVSEPFDMYIFRS